MLHGSFLKQFPNRNLSYTDIDTDTLP